MKVMRKRKIAKNESGSGAKEIEGTRECGPLSKGTDRPHCYSAPAEKLRYVFRKTRDATELCKDVDRSSGRAGRPVWSKNRKSGAGRGSMIPKDFYFFTRGTSVLEDGLPVLILADSPSARCQFGNGGQRAA